MAELTAEAIDRGIAHLVKTEKVEKVKTLSRPGESRAWSLGGMID